MKKIILTLGLLSALFGRGIAQNLQLHYNLGKANGGVVHDKIGYLTTTIEMFKTDTLGYTFFFVDMDYNAENGMSFAYGEIVRAFNIPKVKFMKMEVSYNGGTGVPKNTWLVGPVFPINRGSAHLSFSIYYRAEKDQQSANGQFTGVWTVGVWKDKVKFTGFMDVWTRDNFLEGNQGKMFTFLTEPQVWYNFNDHIALGSKLELSYNFYTFDKRMTANPTIAAKWTF